MYNSLLWQERQRNKTMAHLCPLLSTIGLSPVTCGTLLSVNVWIGSWSGFFPGNCPIVKSSQKRQQCIQREQKECQSASTQAFFCMLTPCLTLTSDSFFLMEAESPDVSDQCCSSSPAVISQSVSSLTASRYSWCSNTTAWARRTRS